MTDWDEIRTALHVARAGTVSGAAEALGVHHATVIRHVDALEARLGAKLFQRHPRGYTPTEAGRDLLAVAQEADDRFAQLAGRIRGQGEGVSGELAVTSLVTLSRLLTPALVEFQRRHPAVTLRYLVGDRLFRLEAGEAHVAVRAGPQPQQADAVVQPFLTMRFALCAAPAYLDRHGRPDLADPRGLAGHRFVGTEDGARGPVNGWLAALAPREAVAYRTGDDPSHADAVRLGAGIGFLTQFDRDGAEVAVLAERDEWTAPLWLVTHVDLHRTPKVQAMLALLKERARDWA